MKVAERGLEAALQRLEAAVAVGNQGDPLVPLGEALHWLYALREALERPDDDAEEQGLKTLAGLVYVRGRMTHSLVVGGAHTDIHPGLNTFPGDDIYLGKFWRWRNVDEIPPRQRENDYDRRRREHYRCYVQDRDLLQPIRTAVEALRGLRS